MIRQRKNMQICSVGISFSPIQYRFLTTTVGISSVILLASLAMEGQSHLEIFAIKRVNFGNCNLRVLARLHIQGLQMEEQF